jgi:hypothetical protein
MLGSTMLESPLYLSPSAAVAGDDKQLIMSLFSSLGTLGHNISLGVNRGIPLIIHSSLEL